MYSLDAARALTTDAQGPQPTMINKQLSQARNGNGWPRSVLGTDGPIKGKKDGRPLAFSKMPAVSLAASIVGACANDLLQEMAILSAPRFLLN